MSSQLASRSIVDRLWSVQHDSQMIKIEIQRIKKGIFLTLQFLLTTPKIA